jgi:hypothetical protein
MEFFSIIFMGFLVPQKVSKNYSESIALCALTVKPIDFSKA